MTDNKKKKKQSGIDTGRDRSSDCYTGGIDPGDDVTCFRNPGDYQSRELCRTLYAAKRSVW